MEDTVYTYDGENVSEKEYIQKLGFAGYEDIFDKILNANKEKQKIEYLYLIQLFDYNCPTCTSGVTKVFVEDIEAFAKTYQNIEKDTDRIERFLKSKAGEIITDYYSDDPSLNIVQRFNVDDLGHTQSWKRDAEISIENGYGWPSEYTFGMLALEIRWIKLQDRYYKLVKPYGRDCYEKADYEVLNQKRDIHVYGNPFWITDGTRLESYVWQVADIFDSEEAMNEDRKQLAERSLSEEQINRVFADIPGDAG